MGQKGCGAGGQAGGLGDGELLYCPGPCGLYYAALTPENHSGGRRYASGPPHQHPF